MAPCSLYNLPCPSFFSSSYHPLPEMLPYSDSVTHKVTSFFAVSCVLKDSFFSTPTQIIPLYKHFLNKNKIKPLSINPLIYSLDHLMDNKMICWELKSALDFFQSGVFPTNSWSVAMWGQDSWENKRCRLFNLALWLAIENVQENLYMEYLTFILINNFFV